MKIHEYQAKSILGRFGVPVPAGEPAHTPSEAKAAAEKIGGTVWAVKAQVHAGGRGKGGGIKLAKSTEEVYGIAGNMLGRKLITPQTGEEGTIIRKVYIEQGLNIEKEYYLSIILDRETRKIVIMASSEGGMEIEEVAARNPEKILKEYIDFSAGYSPYVAKKISYGLGLKKEITGKMDKFMGGLYRVFVEKDASLVEINPLVLTKGGDLSALDAKINFDDNALFRHPDIAEMRDFAEEDALEVEAGKYEINYIKLSGNIGNLVNGAGLAMATMDIIKHFGGEPANFLDVGGGASVEQVKAAFRILLTDRIDAILVNIFGGIMKCDIIAEGIVQAAKEVKINVPLVVRLQGTNVEMGKKILAQSGLEIIPAGTMREAAEKVVNAAKNFSV
jgi:succinyl-CoA synthetase beta subunit